MYLHWKFYYLPSSSSSLSSSHRIWDVIWHLLCALRIHPFNTTEHQPHRLAMHAYTIQGMQEILNLIYD